MNTMSRNARPALLTAVVVFAVLSVPSQVGAAPPPSMQVDLPAVAGEPSGSSYVPAVSADGSRVAFISSAQLHPDDTDSSPDAYLRDIQRQQTTLVSRASGPDGAQHTSFPHSVADVDISESGRYVVFSADDPGLVPEPFRWIFILNPAVGFIEGFRWSLLGSNTLTPYMVLISLSVGVLAFASGAFIFRRIERGFADVL